MTTARSAPQAAAAWLADHPPPPGLPQGSRAPRSPEEHDAWWSWTRAFHEGGWATLSWPVDAGGAGASDSDVLAVEEVFARAEAPLPLTEIGVNLVAPAVIAFGTEPQRRTHLATIAQGEHIWTQLFSEPEAGSDLASLRTTAQREGDTWVLNGQKTWNTYAHISQWGIAIVRTGSLASRHRGLTMFLVPMDAAGITVRPIREMTGTHDFNEVYFDDVRVDDSCRLGDVDGGWAVSLALLADERAVVGRLIVRLLAELERVTSVAHRSRRFAERLAHLRSDAEALRAVLSLDSDIPGAESIAKIWFSELNVALHQLALDVIAADPASVPIRWVERWSDGYLYSRAYTISGGANEVLKNVVARRVLGMGR